MFHSLVKLPEGLSPYIQFDGFKCVKPAYLWYFAMFVICTRMFIYWSGITIPSTGWRWCGMMEFFHNPNWQLHKLYTWTLCMKKTNSILFLIALAMKDPYGGIWKSLTEVSACFGEAWYGTERNELRPELSLNLSVAHGIHHGKAPRLPELGRLIDLDSEAQA